MQPNWSKLEALFRTLLILFASVFVGALVMPLSAEGTLPTTWAAWRPVLAVALSAAVVAEVVWIRSHLAAVAAAAGLPAPAGVDPAAKALGVVLLLVGVSTARLVSGCTPQAQVAGVDLAVCILDQYAAAPPGEPMPQLIAETVAKCGGDAVAVVKLLDAHEEPAKHAKLAHEVTP